LQGFVSQFIGGGWDKGLIEFDDGFDFDFGGDSDELTVGGQDEGAVGRIFGDQFPFEGSAFGDRARGGVVWCLGFRVFLGGIREFEADHFFPGWLGFESTLP
jgi:hypothetical protein